MNMAIGFSFSTGCRRLSVSGAWRGRLLSPVDSRILSLHCLFRKAGQRLFSSTVNFDKISTKVLLNNCQYTSRFVATRFPYKISLCRSFNTNSMRCSACFSKLFTGFRYTERHVSQYISRRSVKCLTLFRNYCTKAVPQTVTKAGVPLKRTVLPKSSDIKRLLHLAGPEKWRLTGGLLLLLVSSGVTMAVPFCLGKVIDVLQSVSENSEMKDKLKKICQVLVVVFLIGGVANFGRVYLMQVSGQNIVKRLRENLFSSIMRQEIAFFDKTRTGELINRLSADTSLVGQSVTMNISDGLRAMTQALGGVGMMFYVSPQLTGIALGIVPPIAALSIVYGRYVKKITTQVQDTLASATDVAEERIGNIRTVRAFAQEKKECEAYSDRVEKVLQLAYKEAMARGLFFGSTGLSGNLIVLSVFYYGGMMMTESQITIGDLSSFLLYAAYVGISIAGMSSFYTELMRGLGASTRIWELIDKTPAIPLYDNSLKQFPIVGNITFSNVMFAYPSRSDLAIFRDFSLTVPSGSVTAVVGSSGSGKSTLAALLLRYYDPNSGSVILDGHDIKKVDPLWLRRQIGTVSQEPALFSCSIADNIAYGVDEPSAVKMEEIIEAAKKANAHTFVESFPEGFNTMVGERGVMLSGGQKQRIAIARAILKDPKILLLDEATSALDSQSEYYVQEALERLMVGRTVVTIAHRLSTIKSANQIAVFHNGKVAEIGSYSQLMAINNGIFQGLVERQTITN